MQSSPKLGCHIASILGQAQLFSFSEWRNVGSESTRNIFEAVEFVTALVLKFGNDCLLLHFCGVIVITYAIPKDASLRNIWH